MPDLTDHEKIERMFLAMYGDEQAAEIGLVQMTREMYQAWSSLIWLGKGIAALAVFLGAIGTVWLAFGAWFKHLITGK